MARMVEAASSLPPSFSLPPQALTMDGALLSTQPAALSMAPAARPMPLPMSLRATEPVRRGPPSLVAIIAAWAVAIVAIVAVCLLA